MPTPAEILQSLAHITERWRTLAIVWHVYYGVLVAGLLAGVRPSKPLAGVLLAIPLFSVSILAWLAANPFNGAVFALLGLALVVLAFTLRREPIAIGPVWAVVAGAVMIAFGWVYPHFVNTSSITEYLYAAPTGLIPCPTLSITIGLVLVLGGLDARAWPLVLAAVGIFYGVFGALRLGVTIDLVLLAGAVALIGIVLLPTSATLAAESVPENSRTAPAPDRQSSESYG